ncbi:MAG TPA: mannose-6-phosphate isomerase, class I [Acidimicrobiales bacterium]
MRLTPVDGVPRDYAWGSLTAIQGLLGIPATGEPMAELWFDRQLPFLLKILAAERALSIQVHPNLAQAAAGFAGEERHGIPVDAWGRNYRDANHKPELLCAVTPFDALCGFRPVADTLGFLDDLDVEALAPVGRALVGSEGLKAAFTTVLGTPDADRQPLIEATLVGCRRLAQSAGEWQGAADAVLSVAADFHGDMGAIVALLLNTVHLEPGEAIYLDAGNVHAYLRGTGVEIMANSDNVLRAGLTLKHVDVPELLHIADFTELVDPRCPWRDEGGDTRRFLTPARDFELATLTMADDTSERSVNRSVDQMLLCTAGSAVITAGTQEVELEPGHAVFVPAGLATKCVGSGTVFQASTPS